MPKTSIGCIVCKEMHVQSEVPGFVVVASMLAAIEVFTLEAIKADVCGRHSAIVKRIASELRSDLAKESD